MEREKILTMYFDAVRAELVQDDPSVLFIHGLTYFCEQILNEKDKIKGEAVAPVFEPEEPPIEEGRGGRHWLNERDVERIRNLRDMGKSLTEITKITGFSRSTVCRKLEGYLPKSDKEPGKGHIEWFRDLATQGMGVKAISDRTGYTEAIVEKYLGGHA